MYKDKEQQKEANKAANQRYRDKAKGITQPGITDEGITDTQPGQAVLDAVAKQSWPESKFAKCVTPKRTRTVEPSARSEAHATISIDGAIIDIARHEPIQLGRHDELVTDDYGDIVGVNRHRTRTTGCKVNKQPSSNPCELTRTQLEQAIRAYPHDQWVNSPEHKELIRRLRSMSVAELEAEGYHVPAWKVIA